MSAEVHTGPTTGSGRQTTALVVFESMFGNTAHAARAIADGLTEAGVSVEVVDVASAPRSCRRTSTCWWWARPPTRSA